MSMTKEQIDHSKNDKLSQSKSSQVNNQVNEIQKNHGKELDKLGLTQKELSNASKNPKSLKDFISKAKKKNDQLQNLVDFGKGKTSKNDEILNFAEAQKANGDDVRRHIEENLQPAKVEDLYMRMFFEALNNLLKTMMHAGATYSHADMIKNQKKENAKNLTNEKKKTVPKEKHKDKQNEKPKQQKDNQEREKRSNKQQSFKNGNKGNDLRQISKTQKLPPPKPKKIEKPPEPKVNTHMSMTQNN